MDALTARKMSTMGLNATKPLLPPVHNLGMIHLKEPLTDADENLHNARLALKKLEESQEREEDDDTIHRLKLELYSAMEKLQEKEEYFAQRYVSHNKHVLYGWQNRVTLFLQDVFDMTQKQLRSVESQNPPTLNNDAIECMGLVHAMSDLVNNMNNQFISNNGSRHAYNVPLHEFEEGLEVLRDMRDDIKRLTRNIRNLDDSDPLKKQSRRFTTAFANHADIVVDVAENLNKNKWDVNELHEYVRYLPYTFNGMP